MSAQKRTSSISRRDFVAAGGIAAIGAGVAAAAAQEDKQASTVALEWTEV